MNGEKPDWAYRSEKRRGWTQTVAIIAGSIAVFFLIDRPLKSTEALKNEMEARLLEQTELFSIRIQELEAEMGPYKARLLKAEATMAETESEKASKPLLGVIPEVELKTSYKDVSEIQCEIRFENIGVVDTSLRKIKVEVSLAKVTDEVREKIARTERIAELQQDINRPAFSEEERAQQEEAHKEFAELHLDCPHEQLFSVSRDSVDVKWEQIERLSESRSIGMTLRPAQVVLEQFNYVLTQSLYHHRSWFRLKIVVDLDDDSSQAFSFVIPTRRSPALDENSRAIYSANILGQREIRQTVYKWSPKTPLAPIGRDDGQ